MRLSAREDSNVLDKLVPSRVLEGCSVEVCSPPEDQILHVDFKCAVVFVVLKLTSTTGNADSSDGCC